MNLSASGLLSYPWQSLFDHVSLSYNHLEMEHGQRTVGMHLEAVGVVAPITMTLAYSALQQRGVVMENLSSWMQMQKILILYLYTILLYTIGTQLLKDFSMPKTPHHRRKQPFYIDTSFLFLVQEDHKGPRHRSIASSAKTISNACKWKPKWVYVYIHDP